jgi:predicted DsbA family dithiol-disulfide isomerase
MEIDIIFDTVCPWCFIGKKRLENALASRPQIIVKPNWKPFLLNPEMPTEGIDRTAYLIKKFGSEARINHIYGAIGEAGQSVEIDFAFERINTTPNSVNSHRLIRYAGQYGKASDVVEALFVEFFINGRDIGDIGVLVDIGATHRLDKIDLQGVPSYAFNKKFLISGAQDPMVLARMLDVAQTTQNLT